MKVKKGLNHCGFVGISCCHRSLPTYSGRSSLFSPQSINPQELQQNLPLDCQEKLGRFLLLSGACHSRSLQLCADVWPWITLHLGSVSQFITLGCPSWELPVTSHKTPDTAWEHSMLPAPALVHKPFIAYFAYLYGLMMKPVQNTYLKP